VIATTCLRQFAHATFQMQEGLHGDQPLGTGPSLVRSKQAFFLQCVLWTSPFEGVELHNTESVIQ